MADRGGLTVRRNAAGRDVSGQSNPNWKGGRIEKSCAVCGKDYSVKRVHSASKYCSLQCVGQSQRGGTIKRANPRRVTKICEQCGVEFWTYAAHAARGTCCSKECAGKRRATIILGEANPNWTGGLSRLPYPWNFRTISRQIIARDGDRCRNPDCAGTDARLTTHHINYDKQDCRPENLIALCSACNSKANFGRERWQVFYTALPKRDGGGWAVEEF
jgi:hypothetical protein